MARRVPWVQKILHAPPWSTDPIAAAQRMAREEFTRGEPALALELYLEKCEAAVAGCDFEPIPGCQQDGAWDRVRRRHERRRAMDLQRSPGELGVRARPRGEGTHRSRDLRGTSPPVDGALVLPHH